MLSCAVYDIQVKTYLQIEHPRCLSFTDILAIGYLEEGVELLAVSTEYPITVLSHRILGE